MPRHAFVGLLAFVFVQTSYAQKIFWHHYEPGISKIKRANLDGTNPEDIIDLGTEAVGDIAIDQSGAKIYWSEQARIRRASLDGTGIATFLETGESPGALVIDEVNQRIYWGRDEKWNYGINRATLDGQNVEDIVFTGTDGGFVAGIGIDPAGGKIYFAAGDIFRANLDGTQKEVIVADPSQDWTPDLILDPVGRKLYWTDFQGNAIRRSSLDGTQVETLLTLPSQPVNLDVDSCNQRIYWRNLLGAVDRARIGSQQVEQVVSSDVNYLVIQGRYYKEQGICIPTLTDWGILSLTMALIVCATLLLKSRQQISSVTILTLITIFLALRHSLMTYSVRMRTTRCLVLRGWDEVYERQLLPCAFVRGRRVTGKSFCESIFS